MRVYDGGVPDGNQFAHRCWVICVDVNDGIILDVRAWTNDDAIDIAAKHRAVPNTRFFFENHVADHRCSRDNPRTGMDGRTFFQTRGDTGVSSGQCIGCDMHVSNYCLTHNPPPQAYGATGAQRPTPNERIS